MMCSGNLTPKEFNHIFNHECGLLGVSETSSDMRDLIGRQANDVRAAEAVEMFCYQTRKSIGGFAAVLGGVETLVFAGGMAKTPWKCGPVYAPVWNFSVSNSTKPGTPRARR